MFEKNFWKNKRVFITGHTGFKGAWLCLWLHLLEAEVVGYALQPPTHPSLFELCSIDQFVTSVMGDIRDKQKLIETVNAFQPEIIFHMAAQPLVLKSYQNPTETYETNVMGTVNVFEAVRSCNSIKVLVNITTDKCYQNKEWLWSYRETERLGGYDPYSSSKACSELITDAYRNSFFNSNSYSKHGVAIASARAGNVIGGGDWAEDRLIPDCIKALLRNENIKIRNPFAIRPWQHVLEPLSGYLLLAQKLYESGADFAESWNFGPGEQEMKKVEEIVKIICELWGDNAAYEYYKGEFPHEAYYLKLDSSKAKYKLGWQPKWSLKEALEKVIECAKVYHNPEELSEICIRQVQDYMRIDYGV